MIEAMIFDILSASFINRFNVSLSTFTIPLSQTGQIQYLVSFADFKALA
jgi:hypothetical protein